MVAVLVANENTVGMAARSCLGDNTSRLRLFWCRAVPVLGVVETGSKMFDFVVRKIICVLAVATVDSIISRFYD